jgi:hypothetical protein
MKTTDIWFASFLKFKEYSLIDYEVIARGKAKYHFDISDEDWKKMKLEYLNSDLSKLKQIMEEIKDLAF